MEGYFLDRGRIGLEDSIFLPLCLVFLLDCYEGVSFLGLQSSNVSKSSGGVSWGIYAFQLLGFENCGRFQGFGGGFDCCHDCG